MPDSLLSVAMLARRMTRLSRQHVAPLPFVSITSNAYGRSTAAVQVVICYARFLEEHKYFEESFKAYERGVSAFGFPHVHDIWCAG